MSVKFYLQLIYKFYWFLPQVEDIYLNLGETPKSNFAFSSYSPQGGIPEGAIRR